MNDRQRGAGPPHSGQPNDAPEHTQVPRARPLNRRPRSGLGSPSDVPEPWHPQGAWLDDEGAAPDRPTDSGSELVNLGFIGAALRRSKRLWAGLAVIGMLLGIAFWVTHPAAAKASTTLLLNVGPEGQPGTAILNDQAMAQSRGVAGIALRKLGLQESIDQLLSTYKSVVVTDRVLRITVSAPSDSQAVSRANAIAAAFLAFRADQLRTQQTLQFAALDNVLTQSEKHLASIQARISQVAALPTSESQQAQLRGLQASRDRASGELFVLKNQVNSAKATAEETTAAMVSQSKVLDAASPLAESRLKPLILFCGAGLIVGLVVGVGIVVIGALVSDRLRRRDDVALALGAPVRLSIPGESMLRRRPGRRGLAALRSPRVQRIVAHLRATMPSGSRCSALVVVPVDDTRVAAVSVLSLAASLAQHDARVVVADLCPDAPAAKLVGVKEPGTQTVRIDEVEVEMAVPDRDDIAPVGPFGPPKPRAEDESTPSGRIAAACAGADVLLTLTTLDPALASDHLRTWAADAVVFVTAGRSSWTKINAVGEMIRLAGTRLLSAVLIDADRWDESLGVSLASSPNREARFTGGSGSVGSGSVENPTASRFTS